MLKLVGGLCLSLVFASGPLMGQAGLGSITGSVQDSSGGIVARATVKLTQTGTQVARMTTANESGLFTFPSVAIGTYTVVIAHPGFKEKKIENLTVNGFQQVALGQIVLDVGAATESVTVIGDGRADAGQRFGGALRHGAGKAGVRNAAGGPQLDQPA